MLHFDPLFLYLTYLQGLCQGKSLEPYTAFHNDLQNLYTPRHSGNPVEKCGRFFSKGRIFNLKSPFCGFKTEEFQGFGLVKTKNFSEFFPVVQSGGFLGSNVGGKSKDEIHLAFYV
ncbi:MAG: hypothetical protein JEZ02_02600 [Desulfatibacillum sp.]|nr:hypothetical protein [Desulfatibacillum sp.]